VRRSCGRRLSARRTSITVVQHKVVIERQRQMTRSDTRRAKVASEAPRDCRGVLASRTGLINVVIGRLKGYQPWTLQKVPAGVCSGGKLILVSLRSLFWRFIGGRAGVKCATRQVGRSASAKFRFRRTSRRAGGRGITPCIHQAQRSRYQSCSSFRLRLTCGGRR
jgi:hypothetical protein